MSLQFRSWLTGLLTVLSLILMSPTAEACKDCPFPMKIGENEWLMQDLNIVMTINEFDDHDTKIFTWVKLTDLKTGVMIATGSTVRNLDQRTVKIAMRDSKGQKIRVQIRWVNYQLGIIQAKIECEGSCTFGPYSK